MVHGMTQKALIAHPFKAQRLVEALGRGVIYIDNKSHTCVTLSKCPITHSLDKGTPNATTSVVGHDTQRVEVELARLGLVLDIYHLAEMLP